MKQTDNFKFDEANVMNELVYRNLSEDEKRQICAWKYGGEYDLYNLPSYEEMQVRQIGFMNPKNETAISMTKILGYDNREIASLYLVSTSIVVVISDIISVVLGAKVMDIVWRIMLQTFSGWFSFHMTPVGYVKMFAFVLIGYLIVTVFDFSRIKRIPMDMALKNVE